MEFLPIKFEFLHNVLFAICILCSTTVCVLSWSIIIGRIDFPNEWKEFLANW